MCTDLLPLRTLLKLLSCKVSCPDVTKGHKTYIKICCYLQYAFVHSDKQKLLTENRDKNFIPLLTQVPLKLPNKEETLRRRKML